MNKEDFIDGDTLFEDITIGDGDETQPGGEPAPAEAATSASDAAPDPAAAPDLDGITLTGSEIFLADYGVEGGVITYEDGSSAHFDTLQPNEQATVLRSLTAGSVPKVEDVYNLVDSEIDLINKFRGSGETDAVEFFNNELHRTIDELKSVDEYIDIDYTAFDDGDIYLYNLKQSNPDMNDDEMAEEWLKAQELSSYDSTVKAIRENLMNEQKTYTDAKKAEENNVFGEELEQQRQLVVDSVYDINDIVGTPITDVMKEEVLKDIMELNEHKDPILMEKLFSDPVKMFEASWFLKYGKAQMAAKDAYWKQEVSKARKAGREDITTRMPGTPVLSGATGRGVYDNNTRGLSSPEGAVLGEEDLFDDI